MICLSIVPKPVIWHYSNHSHKLRIQPAVVITDSFKSGRMTVFELTAIVTQRSLWPQNFIRYPLSDGFPSLNDDLTLSTHCTLLCFLSCNVCGWVHDRSSEIIFCRWVWSATPGRIWSNFTDSTSDSDSSQNGRLRPTPTQLLTPTQQP